MRKPKHIQFVFCKVHSQYKTWHDFGLYLSEKCHVLYFVLFDYYGSDTAETLMI